MNDGKFAGWRKSSHSGDGNSCVEVASSRVQPEPGHPAGRGNRGDGSRVVGVRDSTQGGRGPVLEFTGSAWAEFIVRAKNRLNLVLWAERRRPWPIMMSGGSGHPSGSPGA